MQRRLQDERLGLRFTAELTLTNRGADVIDGWTLTYTYAGNQKLVNGWNGSWTQSGKTVTVKDAGYNGRIAAGAAVTTGGQFTYSGGNAAPTSFAINGTPCVGAHQPPITVLTSPQAGAVYTQGETVPLAATAAAGRPGHHHQGGVLRRHRTAGLGQQRALRALRRRLDRGQSFAGGEGVRQHGRLRRLDPGRHHRRLGPRRGGHAVPTGVQQGKSGTYEVKLSKQPSSNVTVATARASGNSGLSVSGGASLTFTPSNWNTAQKVTIAADSSGSGSAVFESSAPGHAKAAVTVTQLGAQKAYDARFLELYGKITDPANGYFSPEGIPYHSVETLIVEAPDHGHETTSEAYSYLLWLQAMYGKVTGDWSKFNGAWDIMEKFMIPTHADQPTNSFYNASKPATYAPEHDTPNEYPSQLDSGVSVGPDPIAAELKSAYGTDDVYGMHWIQDVDNVYGYGNSPGKCEAGPSDTGPSYINTFQRGPQESVWETVPQPTCDAFKYGGKNGYLDLFTKDASYASSGSSPTPRTADARAVQAAYWADLWAKDQGKGSQVSATVAKAAKMGDYLRYSMYDKYFKKIGNCTSPSCPAGTGKDASHYLLSWYYSWGGATDTSAGWAWRIGSSHAHGGYQNPLAAYALSTYAPLKPKSATGAGDWAKSMQRQLEFLPLACSPTRAASRAAPPTAGRAGTRPRRPGPRPSTACTTTRSRSTTTRRPTSGSASRRGRWSGSPSCTSRPATRSPSRSSTSGWTGRCPRPRSTRTAPSGSRRRCRGRASPTPGTRPRPAPTADCTSPSPTTPTTSVWPRRTPRR
ncbi:hypothetical protein GCM10023238_17900 [Streptomyces heliomycini]